MLLPPHPNIRDFYNTASLPFKHQGVFMMLLLHPSVRLPLCCCCLTIQISRCTFNTVLLPLIQVSGCPYDAASLSSIYEAAPRMVLLPHPCFTLSLWNLAPPHSSVTLPMKCYLLPHPNTRPPLKCCSLPSNCQATIRMVLPANKCFSLCLLMLPPLYPSIRLPL